jgi:GAF domain-containing protein
MFRKLGKQIEALDEQKQYFDLEWEEGHHNLLSFYVKIIPIVVNAERCSIFIHNPATREIWLKCGTGVTEREIRVDRDTPSVVGNVIDTGAHKIVNGLEEKSGIHKKIDELTGFETHNILSVPIKSLDGKETMGAVQVLNKKGGANFSEDDLKLVEEMAHYLQLTIENIYFNVEATGALKAIKSLSSLVVTVALWIFGLTVLAIIGRILWVGMRYAVT